ncbi:MAG: phosphotransferase family protein [Acidimicrobiales bacterium]
MVFSDTYLQPEAPDPVLDEAVVVEAARRHCPAVGRMVRVEESGGEARAYMLEGDVVLKTQRPHRLRPRTSLEKEALFLRELERQGDFPVPRVLGYGEVHGTEYLCLTRMEGSALEQVPLGADERGAVLFELGRVLRQLHGIDQAVLEESGLLPGDGRPAELRTRFADSFERLGNALGQDDLWQVSFDVRKLAVDRLALTPEDVAPVALHSNPGPEHTFVDPSSEAFTGLIDFGDAYRSHPALDLRPWPNSDDADKLLEGYRSMGALPAGFEEVRRTGLVIVELARAVRGLVSPDQAVDAIERLLA